MVIYGNPHWGPASRVEAKLLGPARSLRYPGYPPEQLRNGMNGTPSPPDPRDVPTWSDPAVAVADLVNTSRRLARHGAAAGNVRGLTELLVLVVVLQQETPDQRTYLILMTMAIFTAATSAILNVVQVARLNRSGRGRGRRSRRRRK